MHAQSLRVLLNRLDTPADETSALTYSIPSCASTTRSIRALSSHDGAAKGGRGRGKKWNEQ